MLAKGSPPMRVADMRTSLIHHSLYYLACNYTHHATMCA